MNDRDDLQLNEKLDAFLDGQLSETERKAFEEVLRREIDMAKQVELQTDIDKALQRRFPVTLPLEDNVHTIAEKLAKQRKAGSKPSAPVLGRLPEWTKAGAIAAAVIVLVTIVMLYTPQKRSPYFSPTPVARLYQETVKNGFEPYYECRDDKRFSDTFARRQGQPLQLLPMPKGSGMLGLSYPGGLSRNTTAMLCRVDGLPVMVFVDRVESDTPPVGKNNDPNLHVFRSQRDGLVFYEVTPFETARVSEYLKTTKGD